MKCPFELLLRRCYQHIAEDYQGFYGDNEEIKSLYEDLAEYYKEEENVKSTD